VAALVRLALVLTLAACGGGGGGPPSSQPNPSSNPQSVATPIVGIGSHSLTPQDLADIRSLGIFHVRITLYAAWWEMDAAYRMEWERGVRKAYAEGFKLLVTVHHVPPGWSADEFGLWINARAEAVGYAVEVWQLGNEEWSTPGSLPVDEYAEFFQVASHAIKWSWPSAKVITTALPSEEYAKALYPLIQPDAWALHVYGPPLVKTARDQRAWLPAHAVVWATEFGVDLKTIEGSEHRQLQEWKGMIEGAHGYARTYGYQKSTQEPEETHGIFRPDGTPRPVAVWLRSRGG
jgi:hypothetical protein